METGGYLGAVWRIFLQPELALTLERIAKQGPDGFYKGRTADLIVAQMARGTPVWLISKANMAGFRVAWHDLVVGP